MATVARLKNDSKRSEIIKMRFQGHTLEQCGAKFGMTLQGAKYHEDAWLAEQKPSVEVTEARRQFQLAAIDSVRTRLFDDLDSGLELGERLGVVDRLGKLWDREARLMGLDLQQNVSVNVLPTAEQLASLFGWDATAVIEGTAVEEVVDG